MKRYLLPLFLAALFSVPATAQDIILLNQDGEKVGVAKDTAAKGKKDGNKIIAVKVVDDGKKGDGKTSATIENGVIKVENADGTTQEFKMSDARSVIITSSSKTVVGESGDKKVQSSGKAILVGPDGIRREIDLSGDITNGAVAMSKGPKTWMIGISCTPASPVLRSQLQIEDEMGLVVTRVLQGGAAEEGGFKQNDILMYADEKPIADQKTLSKIVNEAGAADREVAFTLLRGGEEVAVSIKPSEREGMGQMMFEMGPGMDDFELDLPGFDDDMKFEFKQFGPGVIIGRGGNIDVQGDEMGDFEERFKRMQEQMEELRRSMRGKDRK